jgi:hypothetical protein
MNRNNKEHWIRIANQFRDQGDHHTANLIIQMLMDYCDNELHDMVLV